MGLNSLYYDQNDIGHVGTDLPVSHRLEEAIPLLLTLSLLGRYTQGN